MMSEPWRSTRAHKRHLIRRRTRGHMYCRGTQKRHTTVTQWSPHAAGLSSHGMWRASAPMVPSTLSLECYIARWRKQANIVETTRKQANIVETTCLLGGENPDSARVKRRPVHSNSHHETLSPKVEGPNATNGPPSALSTHLQKHSQQAVIRCSYRQQAIIRCSCKVAAVNHGCTPRSCREGPHGCSMLSLKAAQRGRYPSDGKGADEAGVGGEPAAHACQTCGRGAARAGATA